LLESRVIIRDASLRHVHLFGLLPGWLIFLQVAEQVPFVVDVAVAVGFHLVDGLGVAPVLELHAVDGEERTRAVNPGKAVNQHRIVRRIAHQVTETAYALLRGNGAIGGPPLRGRNTDVVYFLFLAVFFLGQIGRRVALVRGIAQADDGPNLIVTKDLFQ